MEMRPHLRVGVEVFMQEEYGHVGDVVFVELPCCFRIVVVEYVVEYIEHFRLERVRLREG